LNNSSGNVLFLILIAVALFAALSYAVSKSTHGTGDGGERESSLMQSSVIQQYGATLRGATARMTSAGIHVEDLEFNPPSDFASLTSGEVGVFHPSGGMVVHEMAPPVMMDATAHNAGGMWVYTMNFEVQNIGTSVSSSLDGNEVMAFLVGLKKPVCDQINARLGIPISPYPTVSGITYGADLISNIDTYFMDDNYTPPSSEIIIGGGAGDSALSGTNEGCYYESSGNDYVYYSVIIGR